MFISYMEQLLGPAKVNLRGVEYSWDCPFCTDTRKRFRMNRYSLKCYCFNCSWGGNAVSFIQRFQKVKWGEAFDIVNFYQEFKPIPDDLYEEVFDKLYLEEEAEGTEKRYIPLPSDFQLLSGSSSVAARKFYKYAKSRGVTDEQIEKHGLGWCLEGEVKLNETKKTRLNQHLFIQTFDDNNKPIYWMARAINKNVVPKAFNPAGELNTLNKSDVIFNLNNAKRKGYAVLCEGVFDAMTVGDFGVAIFGKTLSIRQLILLLKSDLEGLYIMLDPDALADALKMANLLSKHLKNVYICTLKGGDPNEVGKEGCLRAIREAERFDNLTALKFKLLT